MTEYQWKDVSVVGFDELMQALDRADRKGYMPDAIKDEWEAFNWKPAQPEQEPVALPEKIYEFVPTPEPVKWHHPECEGECIACLIERVVQEAYGSQGLGYLQRHLTTPPASKPWVGLTDEEALDIARTFGAQPWPPGSCVSFARAIEARLREKNAWYKILAGWKSVVAGYRVVGVDGDGDCEVECISHPLENLAPPQFPVALRKMWSGAEVQEWINKHWREA